MDAHTAQQIKVFQEVAERRHQWTVTDRKEYMNLLAYPINDPVKDFLGTTVYHFNKWAAERAEYARAAMKLMGITEDDQIN